MTSVMKTSSQISGLLKQLLTLMYTPAERATDALGYIEAQCTDENFLNLISYMKHTVRDMAAKRLVTVYDHSKDQQ